MIAIVLGTRPEIIKMAPVIRECQSRKIPFTLIHTGQHYTYEMDRVFFNELDLPHPAHNLDVGSGTHAEQTAKIMVGVERALLAQRPGVVLVQGDTNTVLGASVATTKLHIPLGHVEAGLRSFDRLMPEEINREIADHLADFLFAPTETARANLLHEGLPVERIHVTGNTIVDAVLQNRAISEKKSRILTALQLKKKQYFLVTAHREENVDNRGKLEGILGGLTSVQEEYDLPVIFPVHPRTRKRIHEFGLQGSLGNVQLIDPLGFLEFLSLEANARVALTDSGGVQEETCILGTPCVTLRENTERPETVQVGANCLAGTTRERILQAVQVMSAVRRKWINPFGDGKAAARILDVCGPALEGGPRA
jgi:UDP-N-acetylglucosamine 2-epimerase (non-hydrolysing)